MLIQHIHSIKREIQHQSGKEIFANGSYERRKFYIIALFGNMIIMEDINRHMH